MLRNHPPLEILIGDPVGRIGECCSLDDLQSLLLERLEALWQDVYELLRSEVRIEVLMIQVSETEQIPGRDEQRARIFLQGYVVHDLGPQ